MDFLEQLKSLIGGGQKPQPAPDDLNEARPWDSPSLQTAQPIQPMSPAAPPPSMPAMSPMEDAVQQAMKLEKQRKMAASMIPERSWNR